MIVFPSPDSTVDAASDEKEIALVYGGDLISYDALSQSVRKMVAELQDQGLRPGNLLALVSTSSILIAKMAYAAMVLGVTLFPLDPAMAGERRNRLLSQAGCDLVISDVDLDDLPDWVKFISTLSFNSVSTTSFSQDCSHNSDDVVIQLITATSGSEGDPNGVMLSSDNLAVSVSASRQRLGLGAGDLWLCCLPLFHIGGISILYRCLDARAGVLLHQGFDALDVWTDIQNLEVTHISLVPAMLDRLLDISGNEAPPETLRVSLVGGGHLSPELAARAHAAGWPLCVSYGMSETASQCATRCGPDVGLVSGEVGVPLDGFEIALSKRGRIMVRGPAVMHGYINPDKKPGLGLLDGGWFETGDLGEMDVSGQLRVLGRADDVLISGGKSIHPLEVEDLLAICPGVSAVAVSGEADSVWGIILVALYTGSISITELERWCRDNIASALRPRRFVRVKEIPKNSLGKLDRKALSDLANQV